MKRVAVCGGEELRGAAASLGLQLDGSSAELVLVDADDEASVACAERLPTRAPRVFVAGVARAALLRAAGAAHVVVGPCSAATLGPVVFAIERADERAPAIFAFVAATGATGRTSLVANLALRVAARVPVVALDGTGTGALAWRMGVTVAPWADIAAVGEDLGEGHLRLASSERDGVSFVGGVGPVSEDQLLRVLELSRALGVVFLDAPGYWFARRVVEAAERVWVCANPDPASAALTRVILADLADRSAQLVVSHAQERDVSHLGREFGRGPTLLLPSDEPACRDALARRGPTGGRLGRAYDAIAELVLAELLP